MLEKIEGKKRRGWQMMKLLDGIQLNGHEFEQTPGESEDGEALWAAVHRVTKSQKRLSD